MIESFVLGALQGIAEWLPVSSEGLLVLAQVWLFNSDYTFGDLVRFSLFLHLGTFFAALVYLRKEVWRILQSLFWRTPDDWSRYTTRFLIISTGVSGILGIILLQVVSRAADAFAIGGRGIMGVVGVLLLITGLIQVKKHSITEKSLQKTGNDLTIIDGILLGAAQGLSVLPGISRSGITIATLLLRKFNDTEALRISFLMSLPIVLAGNIILNARYFAEINSAPILLGALVFSFVFGFLSIHLLLAVARRFNFGWFVLLFGLFTVAGIFL